jgi:hypothetical protein
MHVLVCETVDVLEGTGPYPVSSMLDIERFQTVFKGCVRGTKCGMTSALNHYMLLEIALSNRMSCDQTWSIKAPRSSAAAHSQRRGSSIRKDRLWTTNGQGKPFELDEDEMESIVALWKEHDPQYEEFCARFALQRNRVRLAGLGAWDPRNPPLTAVQEKYKLMASSVQVHLILTHISRLRNALLK